MSVSQALAIAAAALVSCYAMDRPPAFVEQAKAMVETVLTHANPTSFTDGDFNFDAGAAFDADTAFKPDCTRGAYARL